jgi:hypothetical protein
MALGKKRVFTRKNGFQKGGRLYKWSPIPTDKKVNDSTGQRKYYCDATPGSQGEDWIVTYMYTITVDSKGIQHRVAYVACDYVQ